MLYWIIITFIFIIFVALEIIFFLSLRRGEIKRKCHLLSNQEELLARGQSFKTKVDDLEKTMGGYFFFYELARKLAPLLDKKALLSVFNEEIKHLGEVSDVEFTTRPGNDYFEFRFGKDPADVFSIKTKAERIIEALPHFAKLLQLCVERINLYDQLQEVSIHDSLTGVYNRRYFTLRYLEEFERAKKFNLNLAFIMVDVDHFKKINDTYGHLVGDAVLRDIARLLQENIREIDFLARFGGEEFALILPETDKAGAIMVGERLRTVVSREKMRVFDETLLATISVGAATYPQNTIYSDVLIEMVDKALYKAKLAGRNRVGWF